MPCCILAAFLFGLVVRAVRRMRGKDPEPVPTIPKPEVRVARVLGTEDHQDDGPACREGERADELEAVSA